MGLAKIEAEVWLSSARRLKAVVLLREGQSRAEITGLSSRGNLSSAPISSASSIPYSPPLTGSGARVLKGSKETSLRIGVSSSWSGRCEGSSKQLTAGSGTKTATSWCNDSTEGMAPL